MKKVLFLLFSTVAMAQQSNHVDFITALGKVTINDTSKIVKGTVEFEFKVLNAIDTIKIDAQNMEFFNVKLNDKPVPFINTRKEIQIVFPFVKGNNNLTFDYQAKPKQAMYFIGSQATDDLQIWTQGQGKYTSNWFPSFDDVNEKVVFNLDIIFDKRYEVLSNGVLTKQSNQGETKKWEYRMEKPMSSYLLMLAIGKFRKQTQRSKSGVPLELYLEEKDSSLQTTTYKHTKEIFDFLEKEIGFPYPWRVYRQAPVKDFLYAGMENTSATLFNTRYVVDAIGFKDRSYLNVNAHELAHQWFGNLITAETGTHHWLQEGFATYFALLAERNIYGEDHFYHALYETAQQLKFASRTDTIPVLNPKASSLTFYQKGAWALFVVHETLGDKVFKKVIKNYLQKNAFQNVNTQDFFDEITKVSKFDTGNFSKVWLEITAFNTLEANELLLKNKSIQELFEVNKLKNTPFQEKRQYLEKVMQSDVYFKVKEAVLSQTQNESWSDKIKLYEMALRSNNTSLRQLLAVVVSTIPENFRLQYETLLLDASYETQEIALTTLWNNFPNHRTRYLDISKNWIGFKDLNLRIVWLSLTLATPNYDSHQDNLQKELISYTSPIYEASLRQNSLEQLLLNQILSDEVLRSLVNATTHHAWQFSKFGRDTIRKLLKNSEIRTVFITLQPTLQDQERLQLQRLLNE